MSVREVRGPLRRWSGEGKRAAVAILVEVRRSAPRPPGARFALSESGDLAGSVSSGCVEGDLHEHLREMLSGAEPALLQYGITDEMAAEVGLSCGGEIDVLVARHDPADPAWQTLDDALEEIRPVVLVTGIEGPVRGRRVLFELDGDRVGTLGSEELDAEAEAAARPLFGRGGAEVVALEAGEGPRAFLEAFLPPPRLVIVGATPVGEALCHLAAYLGYRVDVVDPRAAFAVPDRFPDAESVVVEWPEEALGSLGVDRFTSVVVLAHDRKLDVPALATALRAEAAYVGLLGGGRTQRLRREALAELGLDDAAMGRIHGPVGLDIGADTPREIAVSILAQMIEVGRSPRPHG